MSKWKKIGTYIQEAMGVPARFGLSNSEKMKLAKDFDKLASDRTTSPNEKIYYKNTAKYFMGNMPDKAFNDMMGGAPEHIGGTIGRRTSAIIGKDKAKKVTGYREEVELDEKEINYDGKGPIKMSKKEYASINKFQKSMIRGKPYVMALNTKNQSTNLVPVIFEEVDDNSMMARATRLISQTAIKEKLDPADVDMKATDLDRKAADKNIFIQLKRAQDMKGKADVEFLDKKKQKVDIRVINKALDMFDKLKPADKAKMQTAMGKSYRDLLKVVQRGKV